MWRRLLLLLAAMILCGCARSGGSHRLPGTWKVDVDRQLADPMYRIPARANAEMRQKAEAEMRKGMGDESFTFTDDRVTIKKLGNATEGGYKVLSSDGETWSIEMDMDAKANPCTIDWTDDNHVVLGINGTPAHLYLVR